MPTNVLITGANRGIGRELLKRYLSLNEHLVIAGVRDPSAPASQSLLSLPRGEGSNILLAKIDSSSTHDAAMAIAELTSKHGVAKLDIVVAVAGISNYFGKARVTPAQEMLEHFNINAVAPLLLYQATATLLDAAPEPKFVVITSGAGSISNVVNLPVENTAYGASKAAVNFVTRRIHYENPKLIAFPVNPGWLQTDLGNHAARGAGMKNAPVPVEDGVNGVFEQIDKATREKTSGRFMNYNGEELPW